MVTPAKKTRTKATPKKNIKAYKALIVDAIIRAISTSTSDFLPNTDNNPGSPLKSDKEFLANISILNEGTRIKDLIPTTINNTCSVKDIEGSREAKATKVTKSSREPASTNSA